MSVEPISRIRPPHRASPPVARQQWQHLAFLHWDCAPEVLEPFLPAGLRPQTFDGRAWVGVTPFRMRDLRPAGLPAVPRWSTFPEINVRTYVTDPQSREGLWFLSLEVSRRAVAASFRTAIGIAYRTARIDLDADDDGLDVRWQRGHATAAGDVNAFGPTRYADPGSLEDFLTGRWLAFSTRFGQLLRIPVTHEPWRLRQAETAGDWSGLLQAAQIDVSGPPVHVACSPGVDVRIGLPRPS